MLRALPRQRRNVEGNLGIIWERVEGDPQPIRGPRRREMGDGDIGKQSLPASAVGVDHLDGRLPLGPRHSAGKRNLPAAARTSNGIALHLEFDQGQCARQYADISPRGLADTAVGIHAAQLEPVSASGDTEKRRAGRVNDAGDLVPLEEQNRARWDRRAIDEGVELLDAALRREQPGPYQVQAAIAACHATAPDADATDWAQIAALYGELVRMTPTPVVALNRAVAVAMADGPEAGLALVDELEASGALRGYYLLPATRADLLRRLARPAEAAAAYRQALDHAGTDAERRYLARRLTETERA